MKKRNSYRNWILTVKAEGVSQEDIENALKPYVYAGQLEVGGSTGYKHYQIYIQNKTCIDFETLQKKLPGSHIERRKGAAQQAYAYCTKEETRIGEPFGPLYGNFVDLSPGKRTDLEAYFELVEEGWTLNEIVLEYPSASRYKRELKVLITAHRDKRAKEMGFKRPVEVFYIYGKTRVGKTYSAGQAFYDRGIGTYLVSNYGTGAFDGYEAEEVLILDEFTGQLPVEEVLRLSDGYRTSLKARYSDKPALYTKVIFISNLAPEELYRDIPKAQKEAFLARFNGGIYEQISWTEFKDKNGITTEAPYLTKSN